MDARVIPLLFYTSNAPILPVDCSIAYPPGCDFLFRARNTILIFPKKASTVIRRECNDPQKLQCNASSQNDSSSSYPPKANLFAMLFACSTTFFPCPSHLRVLSGTLPCSEIAFSAGLCFILLSFCRVGIVALAFCGE